MESETMKKAIGNYAGVQAITQAEAIELAPKFFNDPLWQQIDDLGRQRADLGRQIDDLWRKIYDLGRQIDDLGRQIDDLCRQRDYLWRQIIDLWRQRVTKYGGYSPDWRAINFAAADRDNAVYCFVFCTTRDRNEVWLYDGQTCPDANNVEVIWVEPEEATDEETP